MIDWFDIFFEYTVHNNSSLKQNSIGMKWIFEGFDLARGGHGYQQNNIPLQNAIFRTKTNDLIN